MKNISWLKLLKIALIIPKNSQEFLRIIGYLKRLLPIMIAFSLLQLAPDKHAAETFAGQRQVVQSYDRKHNLAHDFLTPAGFAVAIVAVMGVCLRGA